MASQRVGFVIGFAILCVQIEAYKIQSGLASSGTAKREDFPHNVAFLREYGLIICGGSILSNRIILSAASCMRDNVDSPHQLFAAFQSNVTSTDAEIVGVSIDKIILHPEFDNDSFSNNLAILRTTETIDFSSKIHSITLAAFDLSSDDGQIVTIGGWGFSEVNVCDG